MLVLMYSVPLPSWAPVIDVSETLLVANSQWHRCIYRLCLSPSGVSEPAAEGLDKTHQESAQTRPQLQLPTHPPRLQERRQWQVGVRRLPGCSFVLLLVCPPPSIPVPRSFWRPVIQVTVDVFVLRCQYIVKTSKSWLSNLSHLMRLALYSRPLSETHDESPLSVLSWLVSAISRL